MNGGEGRAYGPMVATLSGALLAAAVALGVLMVASVIGPFHFLGTGDTGGTDAIGLWVPESSFAVPAPERARRLRAWRTATGRLREVRALRRLDAQDVRVVALTDGRALRVDEMRALRAWVESGGGAVLTGALGVRGADGAWLGWGRMAELLDATPVPVDREASRFLVAHARGPLTAALPPGARVPLHAEPGAPALAASDAELRWTPDAAGAEAASRRLAWGRGRVVWLGAGPERSDQIGARQLFVGDEMTRLLDAAIAWVAREPFLELLPWPEGAAFGALLDGEARALEPDALAEAPAGPARRRAIDDAIARAAASARLFRLELPTDFAPEAERRRLLAHAERRLRERDAWLGERGAIARWRRLHGGLAARIRRVGPRRHLIDVTNRTPESVSDAVLRVHLNDAVREARLERTTLQQAPPRVSLEHATGRLDLRLPPLAPGESHAYTLDVERLGDGAPNV